MAVAGQNNYPSLNGIGNLCRSIINDDKRGATGTPGEGQILTNNGSPTDITLQNFMNSAIRDTYRDLRIMGSPTLIRDNYLLLNLPPVNSPLGVGAPNPATQVSIQYVGYFDGLEYDPNLLLPGDLILPLEVWWRQSGTNNPFREVPQATGPLRSRYQTIHPGQWEYRQDGIWLNGSLVPIDLRFRYECTFVDIASLPASIAAWSSTYVPLLDSEEAIADKIVVRYGRRLSSEQGIAFDQDLQTQADRSILKLRQQFARSRQKIDFRQPLFGGGRRGARR